MFFARVGQDLLPRQAPGDGFFGGKEGTLDAAGVVDAVETLLYGKAVYFSIINFFELLPPSSIT